MILTEIDHIAIAVHNLESAISYYKDAFGAEVHHREIVESDGVEEALIKVADSYIQLTSATSEDSPIAKFLNKREKAFTMLVIELITARKRWPK